MTKEEEIAEILLECGAVIINPDNPFTWASGWKSPIYCDNRITLSYPDARKRITMALLDLINLKFKEVEVIAGVATAGIPQSAFLANEMELPLLYIRSSEKKHGRQNKIEGKVCQGQRVVIIEDLISTGGSSIDAAKSAKEAGLDVLGVISIFTYGFEKADQSFQEAGINKYSLANYTDLLPVAIEKGIIDKSQQDLLMDWRSSPSTWGQ